MGDGSTDVTGPHDEGPTPTQRIVLVAAAVVLVGALLGAFLTSSLADGLLGRDDGDGPAAADTRSPGSTASTSPATPASGASPSSTTGPTGTTTVPSTTATTATAGADGEAAIGIVRAYLEGCVVTAGLPADSIAAFSYSHMPADTPTRFYVTASEPDAATATWTVEVATREIVGADQLAQDILVSCPPS